MLDEADPAVERPYAASAWRGEAIALHFCPRTFLPLRGVKALTFVPGYGIQGDRDAAGTCGTCRARYLEGEPDHRDFVLRPPERRHDVTPCVSGCQGNHLVLDL